MKISYCIQKILFCIVETFENEKIELPSFDPTIDITRILSPNIFLLKRD